MGQTKVARPPTFDHLRKKEPLERVVRIPLSEEAVEAYSEASAALAAAQASGEGIEEAEKAFRRAERALNDATAVLRFRSIGRKRYDELVRAHPPKEDEKKEGEAENAWPFDFETFAVALVAASCVEPKMTEEEVATLFDEWNAAEATELWTAALMVNTGRRVVELGKGSNGTRS